MSGITAEMFDAADNARNAALCEDSNDQMGALLAALAAVAPLIEAREREALGLAVAMLSHYEPGDSRAVSDEFVALAAVACGIAKDEDWTIIRAAAIRAQEPTP